VTNLSRKARIFILGAILFGLVLLALELATLARQGSQAGVLIVVSALAAITQVLKVEGATNRSSYNISFVAYGFAFVLLGVPAAVLVMVVGSLVEWAWHRYPWYIQTFNIAQLIISGAVAGYVYHRITADGGVPQGLAGAVAILAATGLFVFINHLMVGLVIQFARGQNLIESGVFDRLTLIIDATLFAMGAGGALIWLVNPYATLLAIIPIYLIYSTLRVPALQRQAITDPKTGLFNARYFNETLQKELARADRFARPLTVVMADLDLLRNINNTYGHLAGDAVLIGVAKILSKNMRDYDTVARFGGEEFAVLLLETPPEQATGRVEMLRSAIEEARFDVSTSTAPIQVTMSFGVSGRQRVGETPSEVVHRADLALYQAKLAGRNRSVLQLDNDNPTPPPPRP
jgi:diguanylate cyclase (GGDEF)-like protein